MARRCKIVTKHGRKQKGRFRSCRLASKRACAKGSFRLTRRGRVFLLVCCPKGSWKRGRCRRGTKAVRIDRPV